MFKYIVLIYICASVTLAAFLSLLLLAVAADTWPMILRNDWPYLSVFLFLTASPWIQGLLILIASRHDTPKFGLAKQSLMAIAVSPFFIFTLAYILIHAKPIPGY